MSQPSLAPPWFIDAILSTPEHRQVVVDGASVSYRAWGRASLTDHDGFGVILVHGSAAHAGWWDHVAPLIAVGQRVVAVDLSGHGLSDRRDGYSIDQWTREVVAIAEAEELESSVMVGHSMGAFVALRAAGDAENSVRGVLAVDPPVRDIDLAVRARRARIAASRHRVYVEREEALARWKPAPPAQGVLPYIRDHVANASLRQVPGGWTWAFDPRAFDRPDIEPEAWEPLECEVAILRAEHGLLSEDMAERFVARLGARALRTDVAGAGHHIMLDQPLAVVAAAKELVDRCASRERMSFTTEDGASTVTAEGATT